MYNTHIGETDTVPRTTWLKRIEQKICDQATGANIIGLVGALLALFCLLAINDAQYLNIRLPLYLLVVGLVLLRPHMALYLLPIAIPWGSLDTNSGLSPKGYDADILVGLLAVSWLLSFTLRQRTGTRNGGPLDRESANVPRYLACATALLLFSMFISTLAASSIVASMEQIVKWSELLVLIVLAAQYIRTRRQVWTIAVIICLAAVSQSFLGYAQEFLDIGPASFIRDASLRVYGTMDQPNPFAGYINMALLITLAVTLLGRNWGPRLLAGMATVLLAGVEFFTRSKGGWLAFSVATLFLLTVGFPRLRPWIGACLIALLVIIAVALAGQFPASLTQPLLTKAGLTDISFTHPVPSSGANAERLAHWIAGIGEFLSHPLFGVGIGNYAYSYAQYAPPGVYTDPLGHAHNYYINIAAEAGLFGLVTFLLFLAAIFVAGNKAYRSINQRYRQAVLQLTKPQLACTTLEARRHLKRLSMLVNDRALSIGLLASLLSVCIHNLVDNLYVHSMTSLFALLIVLLMRLDRVAEEKSRTDASEGHFDQV